MDIVIIGKQIERASLEVAEEFTEINYDTAREYIYLFLKLARTEDLQRTIIDGENIENINFNNILTNLKKLTFSDAVQTGAEIFHTTQGLISQDYLLFIISGICLFRSLQKISTIKLSYLEGILVLTIVESKKLNISKKEIIDGARNLKIEDITLQANIAKENYNEAFSNLEKIGAIKILGESVSLNDKVIFKS